MIQPPPFNNLALLAAALAVQVGQPTSQLLKVLHPLAHRGLVVGIGKAPPFGGGLEASTSAGERTSLFPEPTFLGAVGKVDLTAPQELASVTKPFVAALLWHLTAEGRLDPLAPLAGLGGEFSAFPHWVTPYMLATHTAGIPAHPLRAGLTALLDPYAPYGLSSAQALASARRWAALRSPGRLEYSNLGFGVLALALAQAGGVPLRGCLKP